LLARPYSFWLHIIALHAASCALPHARARLVGTAVLPGWHVPHCPGAQIAWALLIFMDKQITIIVITKHNFITQYKRQVIYMFIDSIHATVFILTLHTQDALLAEALIAWEHTK